MWSLKDCSCLLENEFDKREKTCSEVADDG